jgi:uncharacterized membrane protein (UPF0127 family)
LPKGLEKKIHPTFGWVIFLQSGGKISLILKIKENNMKIVENVIVADCFFKRLRGLMFTKELPPESAMLIHPCSSIHTFFMNYTIDVLYLDKNYKILAIDEEMKPGRIGKIRNNAVAVVELSKGKVKEKDIKVGQAVEFI